MKHWGHLNPKRSICWANIPSIRHFNKGKLERCNQEAAEKPTTRYVNKEGRLKFQGNSKLRATQPGA